jgi:hypothetical protein
VLAPRTLSDRHDLAAGAADNGVKVLGPTCEGDGFLFGIKGAVIGSGDASLVAGNVIKHSLDDMRQYA